MTKLALIFSLFIMSLPLWANSVEKADNEPASMNGLLLSLNTLSTGGARSPGRDDTVRRPGLDQDPSRKPGYSSERKDVSSDNTPRTSGPENTPRSPGVDKSQRTYGSNKKITPKRKQRRVDRDARVKKERDKMIQEDLKNNPFSKYR